MLREEWETLGAGAKRLYVREWLPNDQIAKAVVVIAHGHGEHGERYQFVAKQFTEAGYIVVALDHQGHGRSEGKRGHMISIDAALDDTMRVMEEARNRHPDLAMFLYGHSMGGNIAFNCTLRHKPDIKGLILTSPWLRLAFKPPAVKEWLGRGVATILPSLPMSTHLKHEDLFRPSKLNIPPIGDDPLNHTTITPKAYLEVQRAGEWALQNRSELHVPLLLMHGTADRVTSYETSKQLAKDLGRQCEWVSVEDGLHELHNDTNGDKAVKNVVKWMNAKLP
ncbi:lysophospholipase [Paenibacillus sp. GSMTC-2017]|uniref:alpha/beta hydrolase n=1 Tax=Paenibacillus sp. GSMTC-2017 TaxID=2794350 RepID=UPI0018D6755B|nr:alpha/beta hydrolase [Paenibacillus sp. GSMTC-2017]MBH5319095.1 lysophospholipase [Paenibacillus sp. GSMTC-2017]